jgi:hypothetical protein
MATISEAVTDIERYAKATGAAVALSANANVCEKVGATSST